MVHCITVIIFGNVLLTATNILGLNWKPVSLLAKNEFQKLQASALYEADNFKVFFLDVNIPFWN